MGLELTAAQAKALGIDIATGRARKSKAGENLTAPHPYRCAGPRGCGEAFPTYAAADKHLPGSTRATAASKRCPVPERIQLRRTKGWRKPAGAVVVARPSRWGNPFQIGSNQPMLFVHDGRCVWWETTRSETSYLEAHAKAVELFHIHIGPMGNYEPDDLDAWLAPLRGHDLACWCPLTDAHGAHLPCHADVLLDLANRP